MQVIRLAAATGTALLTAVFAGAPLAAPTPTSAAKNLPADEPARPAVSLAKLAQSRALRAADARNRAASQKNLERIAFAVHNHAAEKNADLPADVVDKGGKALLSWRVRILPYIGERDPVLASPDAPQKRPFLPLYKQFKLDQPWDSKHNLPLVAKMPEVFGSPRVVVKRKGYTVYQVFSGPGALFNPGKAPYKLGAIPDGTSNTILLVESSTAVPWTKPADIPFDKDKALPDFGKAFGGQPLAALADGSVRILDLKKISPRTLKNAITPADGNLLGADW
jgi:hypothetical protein